MKMNPLPLKTLQSKEKDGGEGNGVYVRTLLCNYYLCWKALTGITPLTSVGTSHVSTYLAALCNRPLRGFHVAELTLSISFPEYH